MPRRQRRPLTTWHVGSLIRSGNVPPVALITSPIARRFSLGSELWVAANPEKAAANGKAWRARDLEHARAIDREWARANLEKVAVKQQNCRARNFGGGQVTEDEWLSILEEFDNCCAYCNDADTPLQMEHMTPLSRGGLHHKDNVVPACGPCNRRKGRLTALEFLSRPQPSRKVSIR